jgi:autotransporter-associated beta strand protein
LWTSFAPPHRMVLFPRFRSFLTRVLLGSGAVALCLAMSVARANVAGGGSTGANVTLTSNATTAILNNGIVNATVVISSAEVTSMFVNNVQTVGNYSEDSDNNIYFSMDGGNTFEEPHNCALTVTANTGDIVDISCKQTYVSGNTAYIHPEDIDIHFVLGRGNTGLYVYAVLTHPASYANLTMGEWRMVWKLPHDTSTTDPNSSFYFEKEYVDNFRHHVMPNYYDTQHSTGTRIQEITLLNTGVRAGLYDCKYEFNMEYNTFGVWGHASDVNQAGVWAIPGSFEFFNDGPTHQDLTLAYNYTLVHFGRDHYDGSSTFVNTGTSWSKIFGPYFLYYNTGATADACWADAQAQAAAEQAAWPYSWLTTNSNYPLASGRGTVSGRFLATDALKPAVSGAYAWVGLATPDTSALYQSNYVNYDWQFDSNNYEYWTQADAGGNFTIPNARPGNYTLYAFTYGAVGQYSQANVNVNAAQTTALGNVNWTITHPGNWIAWEIGVPDRSADKFNNGTTDYYIPYAWTNFSSQFTNPLTYNVTTSNWATAWNYAHDFWQVGGNYSQVGTLSLWPWNVNFNLTSVPSSGNATLTVAWAGSYLGHLEAWVNRATTSNPNVNDDDIPAGGGDGLLREGVHAKYGYSTFTIPVSDLVAGSNTIIFEQINGSLLEANHMMYDYIDLEMPGTAPSSQPAVGRAFTWLGGSGNNSWDAGTYINWTNGGGNSTFEQGDVVTFDDTGSNSPSIILYGTLKPNGLTVNATQSYTFTGNGSIAGNTTLVKNGAGTLTLANNTTNTFTGNTTVSGGTLAIDGAVSNSARVEVQSGGTLDVAANLTTGTLLVDTGGVVAGSAGNITAGITNNGTITLSSGGTFKLGGAVTNNGTVRVTNGTLLSVTGAFTNNGVLDLITGAQTLPQNFTNHGVVLDSSVVAVSSVTAVGGTVEITIPSYAGHNYQLQWSPSLNPVDWENLGSAQAGTGSTLEFTDTTALTDGIGFYRVVVAP